jgi:hypothetical protein
MKRYLVLFLWLLPSLAFAQGGSLVSGIIVLDATGRPSAGATVTVCSYPAVGVPCTNTTTIYSDPGLTIPKANPSPTDGQGNFIAFAAPGIYAYTITGSNVTSTGQPFVATVAGTGGGSGNVITGVGQNVSFGPTTVTALTSSSITNSGNTTSGSVTSGDINNIVAVDGVHYTNIAAALGDAKCNNANDGCTIDMRGNNSVAALALGSFDPGAHPVTLLLGPYTYTVTQIVVETNFHLVGAGMGSTTGVIAPTILQATSASTDVFVLPPQARQPVQHLLLEGFRLYAPAGDTSNYGIRFVAAQQGGIWYSTFKNICVGICGPGLAGGFGGGTLIFDGSAGGSPPALNQFIDMHSVQGFRATTGYALGLTGANGQFTFDQVEFDGTAQTDGGTDVFLGSTAGNTGPYSITFNALTAQHSNVAVNVAGAQDITFINSHHETVNGAYLLEEGTGAVASRDITIMSSSCGNFCGNNSGSGYFAKDLNPGFVSAKLLFNDAPSPDALLVGFPINNTTGTYFSAGNEVFGAMAAGLYTSQWQAKRFGSVAATNLTCSNIAFTGSWGTSPSCTAVTGTDGGFTVTVASGSGSPGANPGVVITFADGSWSFAPICVPSRTDVSSPAGGYWSYNLPGSATAPTIQFIGTPTASTAYGMSVVCFGKQN